MTKAAVLLGMMVGSIWAGSLGMAQVPADAPTAAAAPVDPFPIPDRRYFTATTPSVETVDAFLKALWGYDAARIWRVEAIQTTAAANTAKVVVFVSEKSPGAKVSSMAFYALPDGKHAIADMSNVIPFGATPFAETRAMLQARATGASRGGTSKDLMLVEFADLQCPHCKEVQGTMDNLVRDFPKARVVFQPFPLVDIHDAALKSAEYGVCVQQRSDAAFFAYAEAVFASQESLTAATADAILGAAVTKAGLDKAAIAACAATPATAAVVAADIKLAEDAGVDQTPMLAVNGHLLPMGQIPYETLKRMIVYQAAQDGAATGAAANVLDAPAPVLTTLPK